MEQEKMEQEANQILFRGKPLEVGSFDDYNFCLPDKRLFDVAEILVLHLSFAYIVIKNVGMRGEDKINKMLGDKKVPISELDFIDVTVDELDLGRSVNPSFTGKNLVFDARPRERMMFGRM